MNNDTVDTSTASKQEPTGTRRQQRATARIRSNRSIAAVGRAQSIVNDLTYKINQMDAYFLELAAIVGVDLQVVVAEGGNPVEVMRGRIMELAALRPSAVAVPPVG